MLALPSITNFIKEARGIDLDSFRPSFLKRRLSKRTGVTNCTDLGEYYKLLKQNQDEIDALLNELTINVSWFFRSSISCEFLKANILPALIQNKTNRKDNLIRIWSAGCACGEEPYTMAILLNEVLKQEADQITVQIFATDVDKTALLRAKKGIYGRDAVKNIPYGLLTKYFNQSNDHFQINSVIREMVHFSDFDLLDKKHFSPPEAVFANFDIVTCQNVLIYYQLSAQKQIFAKLTQSVAKGGYLILGEAEELVNSQKAVFRKVFDLGRIYQKH
ncbi:MAG: protein-glutamate O-methyltransferase CheR [Candidatus Marinimicrobia bacterium]|nr:protein-glutamate O-methyltransferase CheR [Candidatus Neomarinimicrobiota bacterium]